MFKDKEFFTKDTVIFAMFFFFVAALMLCFAWFSIGQVEHPRAAAFKLLLWASGCAATGATFGFLFGVPKVMAQQTMSSNSQPGDSNNGGSVGETDPFDPKKKAKKESQLSVNTNMTEISDWLTKIIVGVGLVELRQMPAALKRYTAPLADALGAPGKPEVAVAASATVGFCLIGLLFGYVMTRIFLQAAFDRADKALNDIEELKSKTDKQERQIANVQDQTSGLISAVAGADANPRSDDRNLDNSSAKLLKFSAKSIKNKAERERTATDWYILAKGAFSKEEYNEAIQLTLKGINREDIKKEEKWMLYNLLGMSYHYLQPSNWEIGDNDEWKKGAVKAYTSAIEFGNELERATSRANLAFVFMDADELDEARSCAKAVLQKDHKFDLARVVAAASSVPKFPAEAIKWLNEIANIEQFAYLFTGEDIHPETVSELAKLDAAESAERLKPHIKAFLERFVK